MFGKATPVFEELSQNPFVALTEESANFKIIQTFVVNLYSKNLDTADVNEARKLLFGMNQNMERIPPTCDALLQHTKRSIYQTGKFKYKYHRLYIGPMHNGIPRITKIVF